jgi:thiamine kinase-like enzyme
LSEGHYQKLYKGSRDFIGERIPVCATHGDFNPHNILFARSKIGIVDWENFRRQGNPFSDLIHLFVVTSFHLFKDENRPGTGFQNFFLRKNWFRDFVFEKMRSYCSELKINYELLEFFLPIHLINMGLQEIRQNPDQIDEPQIWANAVQLYFDSTWKSS